MSRICALILAVCTIALFYAMAIGSNSVNVEEISLSGCNNKAVCSAIQQRLLTILNSIDQIDSIAGEFTQEGFSSFIQLHAKAQFYCVNVLYEIKLLNLPDGGYETRGIRVRVNMGQTKGNPDQYLVLTFNDQLLVSDARFAIENHHHERILEDGVKLEDLANRQKILHFIEIFRTAYNRKDIAFLKQAYSEDALIIVGRVLEVAPKTSDMLQHSLLTKDQIRFVKLSKVQYLANLERVFDNNDFIKVDFEEIEIMRHDSIGDIYGVTLRQRWQSGSYSDEGYLFVMIDFMDKDKPLIHVRTWQPEKFPDGSVINLYDFNIIE